MSKVLFSLRRLCVLRNGFDTGTGTYNVNNTSHDGDKIVAIDGPAGAGKSTVSRRVAAMLGFAFLDTGAMYRAATWRALKHGVALDDAEAVTASTRAMRLELAERNAGLRVYADGEDVTDAIRSPEVTRNIFRLDQVPGVRRRLVELQREFGCRRPTVAEGRDIGTVVFPNARCKIYLDASLECRARRRALEMEERGVPVDFPALIEEIRERDEKTMNRADSPLRRAADAVLVDTTDMNLEQVVDTLTSLARERL
ncbi:MAG TPA: (d)CMP kinase [Candidatus Hydrogenedentes bacterium]|nr:(d)CMP kinase [Candidatus Hydrogenedentota bacterium]